MSSIFTQKNTDFAPLSQGKIRMSAKRFYTAPPQNFFEKRKCALFFLSCFSSEYIEHFLPLWQPIYGQTGERLSSSYVYFPVLQCEHKFRLNIIFIPSSVLSCISFCLPLQATRVQTLKSDSRIPNRR